jgi:uncharacterized membrane protein
MKDQNKFILKMVVILMSVLAILPILAPIFAAMGMYPISSTIYTIYEFFCHQRPSRSYHIFDYQIAYCAREVGTFTTLAISAFVVLKKEIYMPKKLAIPLFILGLLPMAFDGGIQMVAELSNYSGNLKALPFYESMNFTRTLTGIFLGTFTGTALFSQFFSGIPDVKSVTRKALIQSLLLTFAIAYIITSSIVALSYFTSEKYAPSSALTDLTSRIPGYNYEIVPNGGHTGSKYFRFFTESNITACIRAGTYMPEEFKKKCL